MNKRFDYLISAFRNNSNPLSQKIAYFKVHKEIGKDINSGKIWSREEIIDAIVNGKVFFTVHKNETGGWEIGDRVYVVNYKDNLIIADTLNYPHDHLTGIDEF